MKQWRSFLWQNGRDFIDQPSFAFIDHKSYMTNSYSKAALVFWTLEGLIGEEAFSRVLKTYASRSLFAHPQPHDFIQLAQQESPIDLE